MSQKPLCDCNQGRLPCTCKAMSKLSYRMQDKLRDLHKRPSGYYGSCTNSTMNALKKRGLVDIEWSEVPGSIYRREKWVITPEGVAALNSKATEGASHE